MVDFFYNLFVFFAYLVPGHYAWIAIVIITILLRLIFLKPAINMTHMQHKQKNLQPKVDELKVRHAGDKQAEQKALMELYKQEGVNPLSSCLPMIVQIVVLIGFYRIFTSIGLGPIHADHLYSFTPRPDFINSSFFGMDLAKTVAQIAKDGGVVSVLAYAFPVITGGTQLIQSLQMRALQPKPSGSGNDKTEGFQKALNSQMTFLLPIMTAYISYTLTAALSIYWITQTIFMILQQKYIMDALKKKGMVSREAVVGSQSQDKKTETKSLASGPRSVFKKGDVVVEVRKKN